MINFSGINIFFSGANVRLKDYEKKNFLDSIPIPPNEGDIFERTISSCGDEVDADRIYLKIGKILENNHCYEKAKILFAKRKQHLVDRSAPANFIRNADADLERIDSKLQSATPNLDCEV